MLFCYKILTERHFNCLQQILSNEKKDYLLNQEIILIKDSIDNLNFLNKNSILIIDCLSHLGKNFTQIINNLYQIIDREAQIICLEEQKIYNINSPEIIFALQLINIRLSEIKKSNHLRQISLQKQGKKTGRKSSLTPQQKQSIINLAMNTDLNVSQICELKKISKATYYRILKNP